ncbi:MAG TPA: prepilin-type N-terminal cleavage/methylation domain-containing protein [Bryobacteraceae bacterium]|nr:prepilin-type N-terminal cleavage/methylation domain-containing protein [Bryobacteraceae bacterium]
MVSCAGLLSRLSIRRTSARRRVNNPPQDSILPHNSGVTLLEMLIVVAIISLIVGISFPALTSGIDSLRLNSATNGVVSFLNQGLTRAERQQQVVQIIISQQDNTLFMRSTDAGFSRRMELPAGVSIVRILPEMLQDTGGARTFFLYPGGTPPRIGVQLINRRNVERMVRVDPITGVPRVEQVEQ